jgi:undecaprenyl-diphosphatase
MVSFLQAATLGALQGVSELFPISSLGHSIILPALLGWKIDQRADYFLVFLVATHFATAGVLFFQYRQDWHRIFRGLIRSVSRGSLALDASYPQCASFRLRPHRTTSSSLLR